MTDVYRIATTLSSVAAPVRVFALRAVGAGAPNAQAIYALWAQEDPIMTLSNVSYHLRKLRENGLIEVVVERRVRGAIQKDYALTPLGEAVVAAMELVP